MDQWLLHETDSWCEKEKTRVAASHTFKLTESKVKAGDWFSSFCRETNIYSFLSATVYIQRFSFAFFYLFYLIHNALRVLYMHDIIRGDAVKDICLAPWIYQQPHVKFAT